MSTSTHSQAILSFQTDCTSIKLLNSSIRIGYFAFTEKGIGVAFFEKAKKPIIKILEELPVKEFLAVPFDLMKKKLADSR
jgi:hypothetical protein